MFEITFGPAPFAIIIFVVIALGAMKLSRWMSVQENKTEQQFRSFAQLNGLQYHKGPVRDSALRSMMLTENFGVDFKNLLIYKDDLQIGEVVVLGGRSAYMFQFASLPMNKYPDLWLLVDSHKNNFMGLSMKNMTRMADKLQPIELEGNFRDSYKVYMNSGQQIAALTALNPASMEKLVNIFSKYDVEICKGRVFIYPLSSAAFYNPETREQIITDLRQLVGILQ